MWLRRNPFGDKSNKGLLEKRWVWLNILQKSTGKHISTEWYPFYQVYVHESEASQPILLSINSIRSSSCECSRSRNVGNYSRQTGYGVQTRDTMTGPRSSQD